MLRTLIWSLNLQKRSGRLRPEWSKTLETSLSLSKNEFGNVRNGRSNFLAKVNRDNGIFFYLTEYSSHYNGVSDVRLTDRVGNPGRISGSDVGSDVGSDFGSDPANRARKMTGAWR